MITREEIKENWHQIKGRLAQQWGQLTEDDFKQFFGSTEQFVGRVQEKTGQSKGEVEAFLDRAICDASNFADRSSAAVSDAASNVGHWVGEGWNDGTHRAGLMVEDVLDVARRRPGQAVAIAFGVGVAATLLLLANKRRA